MIPKSQMTIPLEGTPVVVWWEDAWSIAGADAQKEEFIERSKEGALRVDCGWLVEKNDNFVLLALTLDPPPPGIETGYGGPSRIPRCLIRKIVKLCPSSPKRRSSSNSRSRSRQPSASPSPPQQSPSPPSSTRVPVDVRLTASEFVAKFGPPDLGPGVIEPLHQSTFPNTFPNLPEDDMTGNLP